MPMLSDPLNCPDQGKFVGMLADRTISDCAGADRELPRMLGVVFPRAPCAPPRPSGVRPVVFMTGL